MYQIKHGLTPELNSLKPFRWAAVHIVLEEPEALLHCVLIFTTIQLESTYTGNEWDILDVRHPGGCSTSQSESSVMPSKLDTPVVVVNR